MGKPLTVFLLLLAVLGLVAVRFFETTLFYDPLTVFFETGYLSQELPAFDGFKLLGNIFIRYVLNTVLSLCVIWLLFKKTEILKLSLLLYAVLFLILALAYILLLYTYQEGNYLTLFYVRRFLIQPLFLLILLPAFYFQKKS
ncbi:exosortase F system-associated membrane protein [Marixanthomonas spongiae]|uniref:Exosortase F system-associated protein n=1 Tax=Marixanthomonas spongiae TaxID=2174845 RepID=A0A2U0I7Y4_9FLAO|nr:exosortase F system-associated protein [Marixanthomonas spongiae]PVW17209.1 exosortase F system-associated protein [Marixanthomonas spongiae]